jgi:DNA transposition AAA+ family ATPase
MITVSKKNEIVAALEREKHHLGSMSNVAKKLGISLATISANLLKQENWVNTSDSMWANIAAKLGLSLVNREWVIAPTANYKVMVSTMQLAQREGLFLAVSELAGSGKTAAITDYVKKSPDHSVYYLQCEEWSRRSFLSALCSQFGIEVTGSNRIEILIDSIVRFFKQRTNQVSPLLILDEADKLRPAALRFLITLYNRLEDEVGVVMCGTDNLEMEINRGVKRSVKGYDEIDSRFGRTFIKLRGTTKADVALICQANGISDEKTIEKIFRDCNPFRRPVGKQYLEIVKDVRDVKRRIKIERLRLQKEAGHSSETAVVSLLNSN